MNAGSEDPAYILTVRTRSLDRSNTSCWPFEHELL